MVRASFCIVVAVGLFWPVATRVLETRRPAPAKVEQAAALIVPEHRHACLPEPGERAVFILGCLVLPALACGLDWAGRRAQAVAPVRLPAAARWVAGLAAAATAGWFCWWVFQGEKFFHLGRVALRDDPVGTATLLAAGAAAIACGLDRWRAVRAGLYVLVAGVIGVVGYAHAFDDTWPYAGHFHFNAMFTPSVQVHFGTVLLVDGNNQYGLYPHFLQPVFAVLGLTVWNFTAVMGVLTAAGLAAAWAFLAGGTRRPLVAAVGLLALVSNTWMFHMRNTNFDLYFQYYPIRFVFPAGLLLLAARYFRRPGRAWYAAATGWAAAGVLWNLDSGLPAFLTWMAAVVYADLLDRGVRAGLRRAPRHAAVGAAALAAAVGGYAVFAYLAAGAWPHFARLAAYQNTFYRVGFAMLPMPMPGTWMAVLLVYLAGLAYAGAALARGGSARAKDVFLVSILGVGLFAYYQGRSHQYVLTLAWWPAILLLALFLDEVLDALRAGSRCPLRWAAAGLLGWGLLASAWGLAGDRKFVRDGLAARTERAAAGAGVVAGDARAITENLPPGGRLIVVADCDGLYHLAAGVPHGGNLPYHQLILDADVARFCRQLQDAPDGTTLFVVSGPWVSGSLFRPAAVSRALATGFEFVAAAPGGYVARRRRGAGEDGPDAREDLLRVAFDRPLPPGGVHLPPILQYPPFTVEAVVEPAAAQVPYASILGSRSPGPNAGFAVEWQPGGGNTYALVAGDGKVWTTAGLFELPPGRRSHVALVFEVGQATVYVNGGRVAAGPVPPPGPVRSGLPLTVGNALAGNKPFAGQVRSVRAVSRALRPDEVGRGAAGVRDRAVTRAGEVR